MQVSVPLIQYAMMKVLLHICCAPCTIYPLKVLREEGHDVRGYFYNPNIHPYTEFCRRRDTVVTFSGIAGFDVIVDERYALREFLTAALERGEDRCSACYEMRLERAFIRAEEEKAEAVTTTLLYSKYQRHEAIAAAAEKLSARFGIRFLYKDFREGWKEGQDESRRLGLYRQNYCGCIFSEYERFAPRSKKQGRPR